MLSLRNGDSILESNRLTYEPLFPHHASVLYPLLIDPKIYQFIPDDPPDSVSALTSRYARLATRQSSTGDELWLNWALRHKQGAGYIGVAQATIYANGIGSIAYVLAPEFWRQGFASEACLRLLHLLFTEYQLQTIEAEVDTRNETSWHLLASLGFERIAFRPNADEFKGSISDEYVYQLANEQWLARNSDMES